MPTSKHPTSHELLIRLDERARIMAEELKEIKITLADQQTRYDARIIALETFRQTKAADETIKRWNDAALWVSDFKKTIGWIVGAVSLISGLVGYFMNNIIVWLSGGK